MKLFPALTIGGLAFFHQEGGLGAAFVVHHQQRAPGVLLGVLALLGHKEDVDAIMLVANTT